MEPHRVGTRVRLDRNWCPEGISLIEAAKMHGSEGANVDATCLTEGAPQDERRAALNLVLLTGASAELYDTQGRQGAVDLLLRLPNGRVEVAEVTSTIDKKQKSQSGYADQVEKTVQAHYRGESAWFLHLTHGWKFPNRTNERLKPAQEIADTLARLDATTPPSNTPARDGAGSFPEVSENIRGWISPDHKPGVRFSSYNVNTDDPGDEPYLGRLSNYLNSSDLIARKMKKLIKGAATLKASSTHLYLLVSAIGNEGALLPSTPASFTQGEFVAPAGLTDLWLDGGNGAIYHWSQTEGWVFHRADTASANHKRLM